MADTYGVTPADIAADLPGLFPGGFGSSTTPSYAQVISMITTADTIISLKVIDSTGTAPAAVDRAAPLARRYVIEWVKTQVLRTVYTGNDPQSLANAISPYEALTKDLASSIELMGAQAVGAGDAAPRTSVAYTLPDRELVVRDDTLGIGSAGRRAQF